MITENRKDLLWVFMVCLIIMAFGSIPTWEGYRFETSTLRFRGLYFDSQDYAVHIAMMRAGAHGDWAYQLRFTTEPQHPAYIRLFYVVLGHLSEWLGLAPEIMFEAARWVFGFTALYTLYRLMQQIFQEIYWARIAFLIAALGSGLGWLQLLLNWSAGKITPIDFWFIDGYVFFSLSVFPHFAFVTTAMCLVLSHWLRFLEDQRWMHIFVIGLLVIAVQFVNPIAFAPLDAGLFGAVFFPWWKAKKIQIPQVLALLIVAALHLPLLAYNFLVLNRDPLWSQFTAQNQTLSPPPIYYLLGYALFLPLAIAGIISSLRTKSSTTGVAIFWVGSAFLLAYSPFSIQRRFLQNITIPLGILATFGLQYLVNVILMRTKSRIPWRHITVGTFLFLFSLSSIELSLGRTTYLQTHPKESYYPASLDAAVAWFREHAQYNDFVLASEPTSQVLAQKTGMRVYAGHEMETLNYSGKETGVTAFYAGQLSSLVKAPIKWVVYGPDEEAINPNFAAPNNLELVYEISELKIYQVK